MDEVRGRIERELRRRVCADCMSTARDKSFAAPFSCPLFASLDEVIDIISSVRDYSIEPYQERLRKLLGSFDSHLNASDPGARSDGCDCAIGLHCPDIVEIIEKELYAH